MARGERTLAILRREILPNIARAGLADSGLRFTFSILLIAVGQLPRPRAAAAGSDWALMISENRAVSR